MTGDIEQLQRLEKRVGEALETSFRAVNSPLSIHWGHHFPILVLPEGAIALMFSGTADDPVITPTVLRDFAAWIGTPPVNETRP